MAGGAVPSMIFFIGSIIAATGFIVVANDNVVFSGLSVQAKADDLSRELRGSIEVVHVNVNASASDDIYVYAANLGSLPIGLNETLLVIDGEWINITSVVILRSDGDDMWETQPEVLEIHAVKALDAGWHEAMILAKEGISSAEYRFKK